MLELNDLINSLKASKTSVGREKHVYLNNVGTKMADAVKRYTPVDTGHLRDSIHHTIKDYDTVAVVSDVEYAPYVDQGHARGSSFIPGKHMFDKALLKADEIVEDEADKFLNKINILG